MAQSVKPADAGISVGQVFQGKYRVEAILGAGGMGVVAECTHLTLNERVAVKMLRQDVMLDEDAKARFLREAQAAVKLKSEYVARVSDVGTFETGVPYMVMEFLEGLDLGELLKQRGVMPLQWAVELMLQTAEALSEAHSLGIVHRDVKPSNLFVTWRPDGSALIKVLDFGISKSAAGTDMQLTQTQSLLGTPAYMSPEQMRSARTVDSRTDIWSLGTVFYEALEGHRPFEAESFSEMCVKVAVDPPAPMNNAPPGLQQVILKCLAKAPEQRYVSMAEFGRDLIPFAADPHGAQVLVDRMTRMLKRANMDWESGASSGLYRPAQPMTSRDIGSAPVRAQSTPIMSNWHGNTPVPGMAFAHETSQPFGRPFEDATPSRVSLAQYDAAPVKKRRAGIAVFALLALTAAAVGYGVMKATEQDPSPAPAQQTQQPVTMPETKTETKPQTAATPTVDTVQTPATGSATQVQTQTPSQHPATTTQTTTEPSTHTTQPAAQTTTPPKTGSTKSGTKASSPRSGTKSGTKAGTSTKATTTSIEKATTASTKTPETKTPETKTSEPPAKSCDPFGSMHGCEKK